MYFHIFQVVDRVIFDQVLFTVLRLYLKTSSPEKVFSKLDFLPKTSTAWRASMCAKIMRDYCHTNCGTYLALLLQSDGEF